MGWGLAAAEACEVDKAIVTVERLFYGNADMTNSWTEKVDPFNPRDWCPRVSRAIKDLEKIRAAIPPELLLERGNLWRVGDRLTTMVVRIGKGTEIDLVHLYFDGKLFIGREIRKLLQGEIQGFEDLAGRWPWPGADGPPGSLPVKRQPSRELLHRGYFF